MKRFLLLCLTTLLCSATTWATTTSATNDDGVTIYYELSSLRNDYSAYVTYNPDDTNYNSYKGKVVVHSSITYKLNNYSITMVGKKAFYLSTELTSVNLPATITKVNLDAFVGCTGLKSITVNATSAPTCTEGVFEGVDKETCVLYVPEGCVDIYSEADGWNEFSKIKVIGDEDDGDGNDGDSDDGTPLNVGTKFLSDGLYYNVVSSEDKTIEVTYGTAKPERVSSPDDCHFYSGSINIPETVKYKGVTYKVVGIGDYAFENSVGVSEVTIPSSVTYIGYRGFLNCTILTELTLPDGLTSIGESAFVYCVGLEEITIPQGVTTLSKYLFEGCYSLKRVSLPAALTEIGQEAFCWCYALAEINLPESVTSIGQYAFWDCTSLGAITSLNTTPPTIYDAEVFNNVRTDVCVLYVPEEAIGAYQEDNVWQMFTTVQGAGKASNFEVETLVATDVTGTTARLNGKVRYTGTTLKTNYDFVFDYWSPDGEVVTISSYDDMTFDDDGATFHTEVIGLSKGTTYGYRVRVEDHANSNTIYGNGESFITGSYDLEADGIFYNIVSDETCEVTWGGATAWNGTPSYTGSVTVPESVELEGKTYKVVGIGEHAFDTCINLTSVNLPSTIEYIGLAAFNSCDGLKEMVIPDGVKVIQNEAFFSCDNLESVTMGNSVEIIGGMAFQECLNLKSVTFTGNSVTEIGGSAFSYCGLEEFVIPNSVTELDVFAFTMNYALRKVTIGEGLTVIQQDAFYNNKSLEEVVFVGENLKTIEGYVFLGCSSLPSIDLPNSLEYIGTMAFADCSSLESIVIPNNVTELGHSTFYNCTSLKTATLGSSLEKLGAYYAFRNCSALEEVTSLNPTPPDCGTLAFAGVNTSTCILYVPEGAYDAYSTASTWRSFTNIIEMIEFEVETYEATNVTETSATLNGFVKEGYDTTVFRKGFMYWIDDPNVVTTITIDDDSNEISYTLNGLTPQTNYSYHTFAITGTGIEYGEDVTFYTEDTTTGINGISLDDENVEGIYSTSGQKLNTTVKGVNIIRYNDGTVKKLYVK